MRQFEVGFGSWVIKLRWVIILFCIAATFLAAKGAQNLEFKSNYRVFFSEDNPQLQAFDALERTYAKNDNLMFVITPADGNVFSRKTLSAIEVLTEKAWQAPFSLRVDSITNFQYTEAEGDDLIVANLIEDAASFSDEDVLRVKAIALSEPLLVGRLIAKNARVTAVNITVQLPGKDEATEAPMVASFARNLMQEMKADYPDLEFRLTGLVMLNNAFPEASQKDARTLVPLSFLLMLTFLGFLLRGFTGTFATFLVIVFSIAAAMGIGGYIGFPLTPPSMSAPVIILTVAIAGCVHVMVTFLQEYRLGVSKNEAIIESLRVNLQPIFLASATTAIGFLVMNFSEVPPFRHLGNFVAFGVVWSFVLAVTFFPALLAVLPVRRKKEVKNEESLMAVVGDFVVKRRQGLLWSMTALVILLVSFIPRNELNDVFVHYFDESVQFRIDADYTTKNLTGLYLIDYSLNSGEPGGINKPEFLQKVDDFAQWYRQQDEVLHVTVITDIMKRLNKNMHGDDPAWYKLPQERPLAAQYLLLYEMSLPYGLDLNNQINIDKRSTRMTVSLKTLSTNEMLALEQRAKNWLASNASEIKNAQGSGPSVMFAHIGKRNVISMLVGTTIALVLISLILIVVLRSFKVGLISMVPNLVPAAMGFGLWGLLVGEIGLALSIVAGMTLGIVVDDTVHFLSKYLRARRERGLSSQDAVRFTFRNVGWALLVTSLVLVSGFLVLALSSFKLNSGMGLLSAIVITLALMADFLLLPPLLMKLEGKK